MKTDWQILGARLRAVSALILLLAVWLSAPVTLASSPSNFCSMACCIEEGHCCCYPQKSFVKGQPDDERDHINYLWVLAECPAGCSPPQISTYSFLSAFDGKSAYRVELRRPPPIYFHSDFHILDILECNSSSPRAPPASSSERSTLINN